MQKDVAEIHDLAERGHAGLNERIESGYAAAYDESVWERIADDLPLLLAEVRALLGASPA